MVFDLDLIKKVYAELPGKLAEARKVLNRPLTLTEKILYSHLHPESPLKNYTRGGDYVYFSPDRVAMQDATAQMALLQFDMAGKSKVAVPYSPLRPPHQAKVGSETDLKWPSTLTKRCTISWLLFPINMALASGNRCWYHPPDRFGKLCFHSLMIDYR
ncbi:MAG: hypothetical protein R2788_14225 [Saprospiraceae bacterium]